MQLKYKVLWIDDEPLTASILRVERHIKNQFMFIPEILKISSEDEFEKMNLDYKDFDLVLLDYQLANEKTTEKILEQIKSKSFYSEICFYSSKVKFLDYVRKNIEMFEGVYFQEGRIGLIEKIKEIINLTLKKTQDINNLRGLVMAETGDLDSLKEEILELFFNSNASSKEEIKTNIIDKLKENKTNLTELINSLEDDTDSVFIKFFKDKADFSTKSTNIHRINKNLKNEKSFDHETFRKEILEPRNNLAHVKEEIKEGKKVLLGKKSTLIFSHKYCSEMRGKILNYKKILEEIKNELN